VLALGLLAKPAELFGMVEFRKSHLPSLGLRNANETRDAKLETTIRQFANDSMFHVVLLSRSD